jgi:hypothetical protein
LLFSGVEILRHLVRRMIDVKAGTQLRDLGPVRRPAVAIAAEGGVAFDRRMREQAIIPEHKADAPPLPRQEDHVVSADDDSAGRGR